MSLESRESGALTDAVLGIEYSDEGSATHPPAIDRRELLREMLDKFLPVEEADAARKLAGVFEQILEFVRPKLELVVAEIIKNNGKPHPKWHL